LERGKWVIDLDWFGWKEKKDDWFRFIWKDME